MKYFISGFIVTITIFFILFFYSKNFYNNYTESIFLTTSNYNTYLFQDGQEIFQSKYKYTKFEEFPEELIYILLRSEDRQFYNHIGINPKALIRALWINLKEKTLRQGGSTLTQQLVKNLYLTRERSFKRKILDIMLSFQLERAYDKNQILEAYMNSVYQGNDISGFGASSERYFNKSIKNLSLEEMSILVGIINGPELFNPYRFPERAKRQGLIVLETIENYSFLKTSKDKMVENIENINFSNPQYNEKYLDLIYKVKNEESQIGLLGGGYTIVTTYNKDLYDAVNLSSDTTAIVINNKNGAILSFWGGEYSNFYSNQQIGSSVKPFYYALAIENGYELDMILPDKPTNFSGWEPRNFDNRFREEVTLKNSLVSSINIPSIYLATRIYLSPTDSIKYIENFLKNEIGLSGNYPGDLTLSLGTNETSPIELTKAISIFPNYGIIPESYVISEIYDRKGNLIYKKHPRIHTRINSLSLDTYSKMNEMLREVITRGSGFRANIEGYYYYGKTGTSEKNAWFVGYDSITSFSVRVDGENLLSSNTAVPESKSIIENIVYTLRNEPVFIYETYDEKQQSFFYNPIEYIIKGYNVIEYLNSIKYKYDLSYIEANINQSINTINNIYPDIARQIRNWKNANIIDFIEKPFDYIQNGYKVEDYLRNTNINQNKADALYIISEQIEFLFPKESRIIRSYLQNEGF